MTLAGPGILSPVRLPVSPPRREGFGSYRDLRRSRCSVTADCAPTLCPTGYSASPRSAEVFVDDRIAANDRLGSYAPSDRISPSSAVLRRATVPVSTQVTSAPWSARLGRLEDAQSTVSGFTSYPPVVRCVQSGQPGSDASTYHRRALTHTVMAIPPSTGAARNRSSSCRRRTGATLSGDPDRTQVLPRAAIQAPNDRHSPHDLLPLSGCGGCGPRQRTALRHSVWRSRSSILSEARLWRIDERSGVGDEGSRSGIHARR